jgi:hypothetical protein
MARIQWGHSTGAVRRSADDLRSEWSARSLSLSWGFASDWSCAAVDAVCDALTTTGDVFAAAERLGRARAAAGVGLGEALADVDHLAALVPALYADMLRRAVSLGWADRVAAPAGEISDPLTGLVSREYLELRLTEVYQACAAERTEVTEEYALAVVRVELGERSMWQRVLPMILVGESLRVVFDAGETLARLGEPVAVALVRRSDLLARRVQLLGRLIASRTAADPDSRIMEPRLWIEPLPPTYSAARKLLAELSR